MSKLAGSQIKFPPNFLLLRYLIRAEKAAVAVRSAEENVSDSLLIAMVLKGLPDEFKAFITIITQSETVDTFQKFKQALRNFDETETVRSSTKKPKDNSNDSIIKAKNGKPITCFNCGIAGHKSTDCRRKKWCSLCKFVTPKNHVDVNNTTTTTTVIVTMSTKRMTKQYQTTTHWHSKSLK